MPYREVDLSRIHTTPIADRSNKLQLEGLAGVPAADRSFHAFLESLPDVLAARDLRQLATAVVQAVRAKRGVVLLLGGHVIKVGLGPLLADWMRRGIISHLALNGAAAIHDFELAAFGGTSEDVESGLADGSFGMADETGRTMNRAVAQAAAHSAGLGEGLAETLAAHTPLPGGSASVLLAAHRHQVPVTVHVAIGADFIHQHPEADGGAIGQTAHRDFRRLAASLAALDGGGVVVNVGSAVLLPEVFLKALTVARNLDHGRPTGFFAADLDMQRHYRPGRNVVERPTRKDGVGMQITGHHELLFPLLSWAIFDQLDAR